MAEDTTLAGATNRGEVLAWPTNPGEFAARWNARNDDERAAWLEVIVSALTSHAERDLRLVTQERDRLLERFPCDGGCRDYAEEDCSRHGRTPSDLWSIINDFAQQRDQARAQVAKVREVLADLDPECRSMIAASILAALDSVGATEGEAGACDGCVEINAACTPENGCERPASPAAAEPERGVSEDEQKILSPALGCFAATLGVANSPHVRAVEDLHYRVLAGEVRLAPAAPTRADEGEA